MVIVIVDKKGPEREATGRLLVAQKYEVEYACDAATALSLVERRTPDVMLVDWALTGISAAEVIKRARARDAKPRLYVVVTSSRPVPGEMRTAFQAGADDYLKRPFSPEELLVRVEGVNRLRMSAPAVCGMQPLSPVEAMMAGLLAPATIDEIRSDLAIMIGSDMGPAAADATLDGDAVVSQISLSAASAGVEVAITVGADAASCRALGGALLGEGTVEQAAIRDLMRELANIAGGAFKRKAEDTGVQLTTGVPLDTASMSHRRVTAKTRRGWNLSCAALPIRLDVEIEIRVRANKHIATTALKEGMVVAHDLLNDAGALLIPVGTRLTEAHLAFLPRVLGWERLVLVADVA